MWSHKRRKKTENAEGRPGSMKRHEEDDNTYAKGKTRPLWLRSTRLSGSAYMYFAFDYSARLTKQCVHSPFFIENGSLRPSIPQFHFFLLLLAKKKSKKLLTYFFFLFSFFFFSEWNMTNNADMCLCAMMMTSLFIPCQHHSLSHLSHHICIFFSHDFFSPSLSSAIFFIRSLIRERKYTREITYFFLFFLSYVSSKWNTEGKRECCRKSFCYRRRWCCWWWWW